jgi:hypothetical protein
MALSDLGEPITGPYQIPSGTAQMFAGGVVIQRHEGGELRAGFAFLTLGRPIVVSLEPQATLFEHNAIHFDPRVEQHAKRFCLRWDTSVPIRSAGTF